MVRVTGRQKEILQAIIDLTDKHNYPPTVRELCVYVGLKSPGTMQAHLYQLKRKGLVSWRPNMPRTVRVVRHDQIAD